MKKFFNGKKGFPNFITQVSNDRFKGEFIIERYTKVSVAISLRDRIVINFENYPKRCIIIVAHLLIPKDMRLFLAYLLSFFKSLNNFLFVGAHKTISSAKRPPQQEFSPILTSYFLQHLNS